MRRQYHKPLLSDSRRAEAVQWFTLLREADPSIEQLQEWDKWIGIEENRSAYETVTRAWQHAGMLTAVRRATLPELQADDYDAAIPMAAHLGREAGRARSRAASSFLQRIRASMRIYTLSAVAAAMAIAAVAFFGSLLPSVTEQVEVHETGIAQHREVVLSDGSKIHLGARTAISVQYGSDRRTVVLDRGEALFSVAHNAQRPFTVVAGPGTATAIGTSFVVRRDEDRTVVRVTEGKVEVAQRHDGLIPNSSGIAADDEPALGARASNAVLLVQGEQVSYGVSGQPGLVRRSDLKTATAWIEGQLRYQDEPLRYVIGDLNRYSSEQILFGDHEVEELIFTGTVRPDRIDDWLRALSTIFPVDVVRTGRERVLLRSSAAGQQPHELQSSR